MNSTNQTEIESLNYWFNYYGATVSIDIMYMYLLTPISIIAFLLNSITYYILSSMRQFSQSILYIYLKLYILNSIVLSILLISCFTCNTYSIFDFTNTYEALAYGAYFLAPVVSVFYFYSTLLEICIALERSLNFFPIKLRFKKINNYKKISLILFLFSVIINIPFGFMYYPGLEKVPVKKQMLNYYYWGISDFSNSVFGMATFYFLYFVRDILFLLIKIIINVYSVYVVRQYLTKININTIAMSSVNGISDLESNVAKTNQAAPKKEYLSKTDRNLTYMSIWMCLLSVLENIFYAFAYEYYSVIQNEASLTVFFFSYFTLALKHVSNIFVLCLYNYSFRTEFKKKLLMR